MEFSAYIRPIRRWWWLLVLSTALAATSSYLQVREQPPMYRAETTLIIGRAFNDPNPTGSELALAQQLAETYADLVQRRPVRVATMAALGLDFLPEYSAVPLPNRQLLQISVVDTSPERARAVANELANQLILQSPTAPQPEDQERAEFINAQLVNLEENMSQTEAEIASKQAELEAATGAREIEELQSDIEALQDKHSELQANYAALLANTAGGASNIIEVIEPAVLPSVPSGSGMPQAIAIAAAFGLTLSAGTAYLLDFLDDTVRTFDDLGRVKGLSRLPSIPDFGKNGSVAPILAHNGTHLLVGDAFRTLRTGLYAATAGQRGKILLITSAAPLEGKSVVASNLATSLVLADKSVLLIDADLHRPMQDKLFGVSGEYGLAELLIAFQQNQPSERDALARRAVQKMKTMSFGLIVAGSDRENATGLLGSDTMRDLLETVSPHVDYVIIDSPPVLAVADALMLSIQVDGVVVVARAGSIQRKRLEQTLHRLQEVRAPVLGVVLNRVRVRNEGYYYSREYSKRP
jgi:polysaccharide biosynthesis transport protein